ncbi:MAG: 4Fe-4S dicluster domain-containing protein [Desulfomicrobium apsheronum]|nr:4Fe-4S dicluster domain-containing protein [Desulfomicrobium apsheronum]
MDFFSIGLVLACASAALGALWRMRGWFKRGVAMGRPGQDRPRPGVLGILGMLVGGLADLVLLRRTMRSPLRWTGHTLLILGFGPLIVLHAMDGVVTRPFFAGYEPTLDPWQFLRNLFGLLSVLGLTLLFLNRCMTLKKFSKLQDWTLIAVVFGILISGFLLESFKIMSAGDFKRMVDDYFVEAESEELISLKAYWARENGVRFRQFLPTAPELLELGAELHEDRCAGCHSPTSSAFVSRSMTSLVPASLYIADQGRDLFWYVHVGLAFLGLALLPWGKFFHPVATGINLLTRGGTRTADTPTHTLARGLGLDACTRCGQCSLHCSVAPAHRVLGNPDILPMDKLADLRCHLDDRLSPGRSAALVEGSHICTECLRCTQVCSAGIDLQDLWMASKKSLTEAGRAGVDGEIRKRTAGEWARELASRDLGRVGGTGAGLADRAESFWGCVQCTTCTGVCPVVAVSEDPSRDLDLAPQQIMNLLRMGLKAQTLGARMVWSCTTCYKCQEHCPQGVPVADILYELRQLGAEILRKKEGRS